MTERENGQTRSLQTHQLYSSQTYATKVYQSELAVRLKGLGYEIERGEYGQPEIKGYTKQYLEASSPRRGTDQRSPSCRGAGRTSRGPGSSAPDEGF